MKRSMLAAAVAVAIAAAPLPAYAAKRGGGAAAKPAAAGGPKAPKAAPVKGPSPVKAGKPPVRADKAPGAPKTSTPRATRPPKTTGPSKVEKAPRVEKTPRAEKAAKIEKAPKAAKTTDDQAAPMPRAVKRETASGGSTAPAPLTPVQQKLQKNTRLAAKLESRLPAGTDLMTASEGFRNLGQFVAAVNVSNNLGIPFADLKTSMVTDGQSLGRSIQSLKPGADAPAVASRAESDARVLIAQTETAPPATQAGSTAAAGSDGKVATKSRTKTRTETRTKTKVAPVP